jgi:hypothetical protein
MLPNRFIKAQLSMPDRRLMDYYCALRSAHYRSTRLAADSESIDSNAFLRNNSATRNLLDWLLTDPIELATRKLNDPIVMDWAIDRYRQARKGRSQGQEAMEQAWFDDLTLRRWLNSDDQETLSRLFVHLPEERFAKLGQAIGERWNKWGGNLAYQSAPILARYQPELVWRCFAEPPGGRHRDIESMLGIMGLSESPNEKVSLVSLTCGCGAGPSCHRTGPGEAWAVGGLVCIDCGQPFLYATRGLQLLAAVHGLLSTDCPHGVGPLIPGSVEPWICLPRFRRKSAYLQEILRHCEHRPLGQRSL